ncbi:MAG: phosphoribosylanthranilate isomerase [Bacteroidaceae bacterium]|nr:phosphoribosylanthranilate isomerase [Bacteroidaceae bacterium]
MIIKVCGMREPENIRNVDGINEVNWMGFIFFPKSSRNVSSLPSYMPQNKKRVGVFVNEDKTEIIRLCQEFAFDIIQLHGDESPEYCKELRELVKNDVKIIKMIQISELADIKHTEKYYDLVDYFLFETKTKGYGGSGKQFDWDILNEYNGNIPFLITGGIGPDDADKVISFKHPQFAGIDLNSKFEVSPALKDVEAIMNFVKQL